MLNAQWIQQFQILLSILMFNGGSIYFPWCEYIFTNLELYPVWDSLVINHNIFLHIFLRTFLEIWPIFLDSHSLVFIKCSYIVYYVIDLLNTFATERLLLEYKKMSHFVLSCMSFCLTTLTRKFSKFSFVKTVIKNSCLKFDTFSIQNG